MTQKEKNKIDRMSYESMLRMNRFEPMGSPIFSGDSGTYFLKVMSKKREALPEGEHIRISKLIGWG